METGSKKTDTEKRPPIGSQEGAVQLHESDFDGHTAFADMTFEQKLEWLSEAVVSVYTLAKQNPQAGCNSLFDPPVSP